MSNWPLDRISFKHNPCGLCRDIHVTEGHSRVHTPIVYLFDFGSSSSELIFGQKFADLPDSKFQVSFGLGSLGCFCVWLVC
jgi:hypothetical protein